MLRRSALVPALNPGKALPGGPDQCRVTAIRLQLMLEQATQNIAR